MSRWREMAAKALNQTDAPFVDEAPASSLGQALDQLTAMAMPPIANEDRWRQILADAASFIHTWAFTAERLGWEVSDVFGFDPDEMTGELGLIFHIRGRRVVLVDADSAIIRGNGRHDVFYRGHCTQSPPIWALKGKL